MTARDHAPDRTDHVERAEANDTRGDDYPTGSVASPTRTRL